MGGLPLIDYRNRGVCASHYDPDLWFPLGYKSNINQVQIAQAKELCNSCPVQRECLEEGLEIRHPHGIWGGKTPDELKEIKNV